NVVIYVNSGLRADHLGAYGYGRETSPRFDRLTADGTLFEWAFSNGTATLNSIPGLFSSNPGASTGVRRRGDVLPGAFPTIAEVLRAMGYVTAAFTSDRNTGIYSGTNQGFSSIITPQRIAREAGGTTGTKSVDAADAQFVVGGLMEGWLENNADRNFFLYVQTADCRGPYDPPEPYRRFYEKTESETPVRRDPAYDPEWVGTPTRASRIGLYDGEIAYGDEYLGRFIEMLEEHGALENTRERASRC
ncbi:MAG: sulfatase-like hydrolase/transferase, partial [bacterium]